MWISQPHFGHLSCKRPLPLAILYATIRLQSSQRTATFMGSGVGTTGVISGNSFPFQSFLYKQVSLQQAEPLHSVGKSCPGYLQVICHITEAFIFVLRVFPAQYLQLFAKAEHKHGICDRIFGEKQRGSQGICLPLMPSTTFFRGLTDLR